MTIAPPFIPHSELVLKAWLLGIPGVPDAHSELPSDQSGWAENGFVTYLGIGGQPHRDQAIRMPVFQVDCWAVSPTSGKPPWGKANQLAELIASATWKPTGEAWGIRGVELGANYLRARVMGAEVVSEPRRYLQDQGAAARYTLDLRMTYVVVAS